MSRLALTEHEASDDSGTGMRTTDDVRERPWGDRPLERSDVLDKEQVGELLGLRPSTVDDLRRRGDLVAVQFGRHRRFLRADVEEYVRASRTRGGGR